MLNNDGSFTIQADDPAAIPTLRAWINSRINQGLNASDDKEIKQAWDHVKTLRDAQRPDAKPQQPQTEQRESNNPPDAQQTKNPAQAAKQVRQPKVAQGDNPSEHAATETK